MPGFINLWSIVDRLSILAQISEVLYRVRGGKDSPPIGGRCLLDVVGGLIVRREPLLRLGSARFARSLTAGMNHIARVLSIRDMRWRD